MADTDFRKDVAAALENGQLAGALGRFSEAYVGSRARAYEGIDFELLRDRLVAVKGRAAAQARGARRRVRGGGDQRRREGVPHERPAGGEGLRPPPLPRAGRPARS